MAVKAIRLLVSKLLILVLLAGSLDVNAGNPVAVTITIHYGSVKAALQEFSNKTGYSILIAPQLEGKEFNFHFIAQSPAFVIEKIGKAYKVEIIDNTIIISLRRETEERSKNTLAWAGKKGNEYQLLMPANKKTLRPVRYIFGKKQPIPTLFANLPLVIDISQWMPEPFEAQQDIITINYGITEPFSNFCGHTETGIKKSNCKLEEDDEESVANDPPPDMDCVTNLCIYKLPSQILFNQPSRLVHAEIEEPNPVPDFCILHTGLFQ